MIDRAELIGMLRDTQDYISGQEICTHFDVSRNAVWKTINQLRNDGYNIEAVSNRGYKLVETPDILSKAEISSRMDTEWIAKEVIYYDETDSTNIRIRRLAEEGADEGILAVADKQTAGRGRRGRTWLSPAGKNIYMSLLLRPDVEPRAAAMLNLVMGLAVAQAIEEIAGLKADIKWPNDVVVNGKKVTGILTEMDMEADYIRNVIIGIGINTNQASCEEFDEEFRAHATSLRIESGHLINRAELIARAMAFFEKAYGLFLETGDLSLVKDEFTKHLINVDKCVRVLDPAGEYEGIARGITNTGELLVEKEDGSTIQVYAGEVSVRGLYGYV